jgi:uncharacterized protein
MALQLRVFAQAAEAAVYHLRTERGEREVDFIVVGQDRKVVAVEVKLSKTVGDHNTRHLRWLADQLGDRLADSAVITTGPQAYRRKDGIAVVPAALLDRDARTSPSVWLPRGAPGPRPRLGCHYQPRSRALARP